MATLEKLDRDIKTLRDSIQQTWVDISKEAEAETRKAARASIEHFVEELKALLAERDDTKYK